MARYILTDAQVRSAKTGDHHDGGGLFLRITKAGSKSWKFQWTSPPGDVKRPKAGLGAYPDVSLAKARQIAARCRQLVNDGIDPRERPSKVQRPETFKEATYTFFELKRTALKDDGKAGRWMSPIEIHLLPTLGDKPILKVTLDDIVEALKPIWERDVGRKAENRVSQILTNAQARNPEVLSGVADISKSVKALLPRVVRKNKNHPALPWEQMPKLWLSLGDSVFHTALKFYLLNIPRTSNVTYMVWHEVDWEARIWDIPEERMKSGIEFAAPLSQQSVNLLKHAQKRLSIDNSDFVFPSETAWKKGVVSENTWNQWLKANEWKDADGRFAVGHGFRATFGTWCGDNQICDEKMAERCIQHKVESKNAAAYLRSKLLPQRSAIMQRWSDYVTSGVALKERQDRERAELDQIADKDGRTLQEVNQWYRAGENPVADNEQLGMTEREASEWTQDEEGF